jgi:hypothetical protein
MAEAGFRVIFWGPECCGVYSVSSTISMIQGSNFSRHKNFFLFKNNQTRPALGYQGSLPGLNCAGCEVNH